MTVLKKEEIFKEFGKNKKDSGSSESQIALFTKRIEDLSDPKWKGKICTRPGSHDYNRSLLASIIAAFTFA